MDIVRIATAGSVDDGKSTLIGRLLFETNSITQDKLEAIEKASKRRGVDYTDLSLLTDGLIAEREQGITIDVAYRSMVLQNGRRLIIADAPGHEQYTRNMAVAASRADIGLILLDATRGIRTQTLRHLNICHIMGVTRIAIVINKLDAMGYDQGVYDQLVAELSASLEKLGVEDFAFIPVSALAGDNVSFRSEFMGWYEGPTLLEAVCHRLQGHAFGSDDTHMDKVALAAAKAAAPGLPAARMAARRWWCARGARITCACSISRMRCKAALQGAPRSWRSWWRAGGATPAMAT